MMTRGAMGCFLALVSTCCSGAAVDRQGPNLTWEDLFAGFQFERERLDSGVYSASGTETIHGFDKAVPMRLYSAFSFAEGKIRFEHRGKRGELKEDGRLVEYDGHRLICLLPDRAYHFTDFSPLDLQLNIVPPGTLEVKGRYGTRGFLDPRSLGLVNINDLYKGIRFKDIAKKWSDFMTRQKVRTADEGDGVYRVWIVGRGGRDSYWIDTKRGFTLVRRRKEVGQGNEATGEFIPLSQLAVQNKELAAKYKEKQIPMNMIVDVPEEIEIGWKEFQGVWVPQSYKHFMIVKRKNEQTKAGDPPLRLERFETMLAFDWTAVNSKLNDDLFDYHSFGLPDRTVVFDNRGPKGVFVEMIGSKRPTPRGADVQPKSRPWISLAIAAILALLPIYLLWRHRRKSNVSRAGHEPLNGNQ